MESLAAVASPQTQGELTDFIWFSRKGKEGSKGAWTSGNKEGELE